MALAKTQGNPPLLSSSEEASMKLTGYMLTGREAGMIDFLSALKIVQHLVGPYDYQLYSETVRDRNFFRSLVQVYGLWLLVRRRNAGRNELTDNCSSGHLQD